MHYVEVDTNFKQNSRAYYMIASHRFADVVCQSAYMKVFLKCQQELVGVLRNEINANCECFNHFKSVL